MCRAELTPQVINNDDIQRACCSSCRWVHFGKLAINMNGQEFERALAVVGYVQHKERELPLEGTTGPFVVCRMRCRLYPCGI
ncbi:hypothetical protein [Paenibacillus mendelii]